MKIDHIFIFSDKRGKEADDLVNFGLTEGGSRLHPGQGTTNRKFHFENFFLEILWVVNEEDINNETTAKTKLSERSKFNENGQSPFGLCLVNTSASDKLFEKSEIYQPDYFPKGMSIDILTNEQNPGLPWTFRLPYRDGKKEHNEPIEHRNGIKSLTWAEFKVRDDYRITEFKNYFRDCQEIDFKSDNRTRLTLEFDNNAQGKEKEFVELNLTIRY